MAAPVITPRPVSLLIRLPLLVLVAGALGLSMLVPAVYASITEQEDIARHFFYSCLLIMVMTGLIGLATSSNQRRDNPRDTLLTMIGVLLIMPLLAALPLSESLPDTGYFNAWWEMLSSLTTTGASLYSADLLPMPLHLWRSMMGWMGGLFMLAAAVAILAPLRVGGFEIMAEPYGREEYSERLPRSADPYRTPTHLSSPGFHSAVNHPNSRMARALEQILPIYAGLTVVLWAVLAMLGDPSIIALCRAMGTLSTSGISPTLTSTPDASGIPGEMAIFVFLIPALSRRFWPGGSELRASERLIDDPELRMAASLVGLVALMIFARHFVGAIESVATGQVAPDRLDDLTRALAAFWGGLFSALSYLTTTGWTSMDWQGARVWSGLNSPGLILAGLAMMGGGVATTAGGVKLLRVYALARHGQREIERIIHPNSVAGGGRIARRLRREGAYLAFIFFMLFAISIAATVTLISIQRIEFETATILSIAALTNTGPLAAAIQLTPAFEATAGVASAPWEGWSGLPVFTKSVLAGAMVVGRIETLALLALISPEFWRK